jgi:hypothetical protein
MGCPCPCQTRKARVGIRLPSLEQGEVGAGCRQKDVGFDNEHGLGRDRASVNITDNMFPIC